MITPYLLMVVFFLALALLVALEATFTNVALLLRCRFLVPLRTPYAGHEKC